MLARKVFHCIVDDTALHTNITEIENWVSSGAITLVVPLYTIDRLQQLRRKDQRSQIGMNAHKAVKFLDQATSDDSASSVLLQGPDEQYQTWAEVEKHYTDDTANGEQEKDFVQEEKSPNGTIRMICKNNDDSEVTKRSSTNIDEKAGGALSQMLLNKLNFAAAPAPTSPTTSTPPTSPTSSCPQSSKTSPEVKSASIVPHDVSPTPETLKPLINSVVWYTYERADTDGNAPIFLTNSSDTAVLVRSFGISPKNIHQLRALIFLEEQEVKNQDKYQKKYPSPPSTVVADSDLDPKPLFKYEEESDEEILFKPRGRGGRGTGLVRGSPTAGTRRKSGVPRSPAPSSAIPAMQTKPQIPIEAIDPDSFDRGSFGRGSVPLVNTSNHSNGSFHGFPRGPSNRGGSAPTGPSRGGFYRGGPRNGLERGSTRGKRLYQP